MPTALDCHITTQPADTPYHGISLTIECTREATDALRRLLLEVWGGICIDDDGSLIAAKGYK